MLTINNPENTLWIKTVKLSPLESRASAFIMMPLPTCYKGWVLGKCGHEAGFSFLVQTPHLLNEGSTSDIQYAENTEPLIICFAAHGGSAPEVISKWSDLHPTHTDKLVHRKL